MKLEVGSRCFVKDRKPKCISRSSCLASFVFLSLSFVFFMVLFLLIVSPVYLFAFTRNHKTFLSPFFLLKFFEKTTKIFLHSFCFFFGSLSDCLFVETLEIFYLCLSSFYCLPSLRKQINSIFFV